MLKKILVGLVVVIAGFAGFVATRPGEFSVERSLVINAPPDIVFAQVNDFNKWGAWSPWEKMDPAMKRTHSGAPSGVGAAYHWVGNDQVGEGEMKIIDSKPAEHVGIDLTFIKPWAAKNPTDFSFAKEGEATKVTWKMTGHNDFMGKAFGVFMDMDNMVGGDFEKGLAGMKTVSEAAAAEAAKQAAAEAAAAAAPPAETVDAGTP